MNTLSFGMVEFSNGKNEINSWFTRQVLAETGLFTDNRIWLCFNGALVMVGRKSGVCINMYKGD